jgi:hypothetical protein
VQKASRGGTRVDRPPTIGLGLRLYPYDERAGVAKKLANVGSSVIGEFYDSKASEQ